jgi:hypothetical protein
VKFEIGELVLLDDPIEIYLLDDFFRNRGFMFHPDEIGTVLEVMDSKVEAGFSEEYVRILTPKGAGWCISRWLRRV